MSSCVDVLVITGRNEVVAKVMFLLVSVILSTGEGVCLSVCWDTTPREQTLPRADHPPSRHPPGADTPQKADSSIRSMSGRYASYWNAFLFAYKITKAFGLPKQSLFSNYRVMLLLCHLRVNWIQAVKVRIVMWYHLAFYWLLLVMCIQSVDSL